MHLTSYLQDGQLTVALTGEIDHHCAKKYITAISGKIEAYTPKICILDFQDVQFMDSSGIAVAINTMRMMKKIQGKLKGFGRLIIASFLNDVQVRRRYDNLFI